MKDSRPLVSIIVPVRNAEATIRKCLDSLLAMDYPETDREIIAVNDGSNDRTPDILERYRDRLTVLETPGLGAGAARNLGLQHARGEYAAFTDADCVIDREWLRQLLAGFQSGDTAGVGGDQKSPADETPFGRLVMGFFKSLGFLGGYAKSSAISGVREVSHNPSCNVAYRKEIIQKLGGFQPGLWPGEDVDLDCRLRKSGSRLFYSPGAVVYHYQPSDLGGFIRKVYTYGKWSGGYLTRKYGLFRIFSFLPVFTFLFLAVLTAAFFYHAAAGAAILVLSLLASCLFFFLKSKNISDSLVHSLFLFLTVIFWNSGFFRGFFMKNRAGS